jgi:exopolysaccharide biosynthesis polyprenyl glycosylphosphotransferase
VTVTRQPDRVRGGSRGVAPPGKNSFARLIRACLLPSADVTAVLVAAVVTGAGPARWAAYGAATLVVVALAGLYRQRIGQRVSDQAGRLAAAVIVPVLVLLPWTATGPALRLAGVAVALVLVLRALACAGLRAAWRRGLLLRRTVILGSAQPAGQLAGLLRSHPELGLSVSGVLDNQARAGDNGLPLLGRLSETAAVLARFEVSQVLVCFPAATHAELIDAVRACRAHGTQVSVLPRLRELGAAVPRATLDEIWGVPLIPLRADPLAPARRLATRLTDLAFGSVLLILTAPLMLLMAAAVRLDLRLPPLFRQVRVAGRGRLATITKLRTLRPAGDPDTTWVVSASQCTAVGRVLRGTHADELPQLASVVRGDMALVGPRPERPHFAAQMAGTVDGYADRERVRAGLTGWAQVHGLTGDTSIHDRARFDNFYIEYWSIWLDLLILARTVPSALSGALHISRGGTP